MPQAETPVLLERVRQHGSRLAVVAQDGSHSFHDLLVASERVARAAAHAADRPHLHGERLAILVPPSFGYVAAFFAALRGGSIAVPLCTTHPPAELAHVLDDATPACVIVHPELRAAVEALAVARNIPLLSIEAALAYPEVEAPLPSVREDDGALLIYTSGTTGKPKGALSTHGVLTAQVRSIVTAWELCEDDRILHALPLHHLHGILNALLSVLYAGATCEILPRFDARTVLARFPEAPQITLFMAVPTMYSLLLDALAKSDVKTRERLREGASRARLMVSGSAALPVSMLERVREATGHTLLERYGMTEIGMGLGQPLRGERRPGSVGVPFPDVEVRLLDDQGRLISQDDTPGQLQVRGPNVFREYWNRPDATREALTDDGFFVTGDVAVRERGHYRLLGRQSVDILKTGGYKVSALEIEEALRAHPAIAEVCVVGVPDEQWGERVAAAVVVKDGAQLDLETLRAFGKTTLASYKVPSLLRVVSELPRNAMGKVKKPEVKKLWATGNG